MPKFEGYIRVETESKKGSKRHVDFGLVDERSRRIGVDIVDWKSARRAATPEEGPDGSIAHPDSLGHWFRASVRVTRNGERFGSGYNECSFRTEAERAEWIPKAVEAIRKRMARKYAPAPAEPA
jgi:hypothetical protein